jgi:SAM-dependent methyltransferase
MKVVAHKQIYYDPSVFTAIETIDDAVRVIVTPEAGLTSQRRWDTETLYLLGLIERWLKPKSLVLDYGCGIGRLAKPLVEKYHCDVIGVDLSPNMRALAASYVESNCFAVVPPDMLYAINHHFWKCDFALAVWTLQHALDLMQEINRIEMALRDGGKLFVVNNINRVVPIAGGWIDDGIDVRTVLKDCFTELECGKLSDEIAPGVFRENTFWAIYQK